MSDLRDRPAAYEVIRESLSRQSQRKPRSGLAMFFGLSPIHADDASWYTGALGEQAVGRQLARLGPEWTLLHAIPVGTGDSDIDHLLIGPPGVFTLNTKRHKGKKIWVADYRILVSGQKVEHLRNARSEASRASKLISRALGRTVAVTPALVFVDPGEVTIRSRPKDVMVLTERGLVRALKKLPTRLSEDQVITIGEVAARPSTWGEKPAPALRPEILDAFADLVRTENSARGVRLLWLIVMAVSVLSVGVPTVMNLLREMLLGFAL